MAVAVGDVFQLTLVGSLFSQTIMNTAHYGMDTVTGAPTQAAVANEVLTKLAAAGGFYDKFLGCCPDNYELSFVWVQFILDTRFRKTVANPALAGTYGHDADTANVSGVISRFGAAANRFNVGSFHIPIGSDNTWLTNGELKASLVTAFGQFQDFLKNPLTLATLGTIQPILISGTSKLNAKPIVSVQTQTSSRVMRRRTLRVGI